MKQILSPFGILSAIVLLALAVGCATTQSTEDLLSAAGFKVVFPKTATQQQKLKALPPGRMTMIHKNGMTYYVFPDAAHNHAYIGGPKQYQAYQQIRLARELADERLEDDEMDLDDEMEWDHWNGWGAWDRGWY